MKNTSKNRSEAESHNASEAASALGVSIPTLRRMVAEGKLESFRTPGGHLRILADSIEAVRQPRPIQPRLVREASPVLQNRREQLEELTLEAQQMRARRELVKLQREDQEEAERREAEAQAREEEAAQREAELELERDRLEHEKTQERIRLQRERAQEQAKLEAEAELAEFRCRWLEKATETVSAYEYRWLAPTQTKEVLEGLEAEIEKREPADEPRMDAIIARSLKALVEPFQTERDAQERRQRVTQRTLWSLPLGTTEAERVRATAAARSALGRFDSQADETEMRVAAEEALRPICQAVERRKLDERLITWAIWELPWGKTDRDQARVRRECTEILAELPEGVSELEAKEALEPTINEVRQEIEERQAQKQRQARKASLIQQAIAEVSNYLLELKRAEEISADDCWDSDFNAALQDAVRLGLEEDLFGDETIKEALQMAREIIDAEIE